MTADKLRYVAVTIQDALRVIPVYPRNTNSVSSEQDKEERQKQMLIFVFFILLTSTHISCTVGSDDDDARVHQYHHEAKLSDSRRTGCGLTNTNAEKTQRN